LISQSRGLGDVYKRQGGFRIDGVAFAVTAPSRL
jgi:hypothetical protein